METKLKNRQSQARRVKILFKKQKSLFSSYQNMSSFNEPVLFLIRNTGKIEFYEKCTAGKFTFTHSDGKERAIELAPEYLKTFDYGKKMFKGYICDENRSVPLPESPLCTIDAYETGITKTLNDLSKWKAKEYEGLGKMWINIAIAIAIVIGIIVVAKIMVPNLSLNPFAKKAVQTVIENVSAEG